MYSRSSNLLFRILPALAAFCLPSLANSQAAPNAAELFEKSIRPLFVSKCVSCHGPNMQRGGVRLDSAIVLRTTTSTGRALISPGKPEKSSMIAAIGYAGDIKMPPTGKLQPAEITAITQWVKSGAVWPASPADSAATPASLWSLKPVVKPAMPEVKLAAWAVSPVDRLVLAKLERNGLAPSPAADRRTLLRRVTYDLIGLSPSADEVAAFEADKSPDAWQKVVDRLLADRRYGERWGRHWLDVARYSDTKGEAFGEDNRFPFAYAYRDWVIRAFNEDMPYNTFLFQQIAAGTTPIGDDKRSLAALGFLTLGRPFGGNPQDVIDDRIDVVMRGTQGLTVTCARCHDHKFDPIPTRDYYALYGIFASTGEKTSPIPANSGQMASYSLFDKEVAENEKLPAAYLESLRQKLFRDSVDHAADYLLVAQHEKDIPEQKLPEVRTDHLSPVLVLRWRAYLESTKGDLDPIMAPWQAYAALAPAKFTAQSRVLARQFRANADQRVRLNWQVAMLFASGPPASLKDLAGRYARLFSDIDAQWQRTLKAAAESRSPAPTMLPVPAQEAVRQILYADNAPLGVPPFEVEQSLSLAERSKLEALRRKVRALQTSSRALPHALVLEDNPNPENAHIFVRGDADNPGDEVPRKFLAAVGGPARKSVTKGSGRLELAQAITDPHNPLTARVIVNRVWMYHFGSGLVRTPGDFGSRGEPPTHPELLDWLAANFMEQGWSIKQLHRTILLSNVYQQSSIPNSDGERLDADNRFLWRQNRQRLDFEEMRDSMLLAGGEIEPCTGGPPYDLMAQPFDRRRTIYGLIDRENLTPVFRVFDFASPDTLSPQRFVTISPQQALFLMNSQFAVEQAIRLAEQVASTSGSDVTKRADALYRTLFERAPTSNETSIAVRFLSGSADKVPPPTVVSDPAWSYGYGRFDEQAKRVTGFTTLKYWGGQTWMGGPNLPDPVLGNLFINAAGGGPGGDPDHDIIRRWTAPASGSIRISGAIKHEGKMGDGITARIVSSRTGLLGAWEVFSREQTVTIENVEVSAGDTIDFIADCRDNDLEDKFSWASVIQLASPARSGGLQTVAGTAKAVSEWNAQRDFAGPTAPPRALTAWEKYVQTVLLSNEFAFIE